MKLLYISIDNIFMTVIYILFALISIFPASFQCIETTLAKINNYNLANEIDTIIIFISAFDTLTIQY